LHVRQKPVIAQQLFQPRLIDCPQELQGAGIEVLKKVGNNAGE
jgi:hypothetical protein